VKLFCPVPAQNFTRRIRTLAQPRVRSRGKNVFWEVFGKCLPGLPRHGTFSRAPDNRTVVGWLRAGIASAIGGIWAAVKFFRRAQKARRQARPHRCHAPGKGPPLAATHGYAAKSSMAPVANRPARLWPKPKRPLIDWVTELSAENASLRRQLEEARQAPQAPGSEQALAEAIYAAEKQAEAGQPRAEEALALLAAGKLAEATALFEAEAVEKKTASRASAKEAAAYRNLGAIAGLADPKHALEAYEEAVALDPDVFRACFGQAGFRSTMAIF
jgi:hypothetical protein